MSTNNQQPPHDYFKRPPTSTKHAVLRKCFSDRCLTAGSLTSMTASMIQLDNFFSAVVFGVSVIAPYRAFYGPQKKFARTSSLLLAVGLFFLEFTDQSGDFLSWIGGVFLNFGLVVGIFMVVVEILWTVRREFFFKKNNK